MVRTMSNKKQKVYVLELLGDIVNTPGCVVLEVGGVSTDKKVLEKLKKEKDKELKELFSEESGSPKRWANPNSNDDEEDEDDEDEFEDEEEGEFCYQNYDLSSRPEWTISTYDLLK